MLTYGSGPRKGMFSNKESRRFFRIGVGLLLGNLLSAIGILLYVFMGKE